LLVSSNGSMSNRNLSAYPYSLQTWFESTLGPTGSTQLLHNDQREFYNGELPGTTIEVSNGELNEANYFKYPSTGEIYYNTYGLFTSDTYTFDVVYNFSSAPGYIYLWYDTGSTFTMAPGER